MPAPANADLAPDASARGAALLTCALYRRGWVQQNTPAASRWLEAPSYERCFLSAAGGIEASVLSGFRVPLLGDALRRAVLHRANRRFAGLGTHLLLRKAWMQTEAQDRLPAYDAATVLGSGFDGLAFRLARRFPTKAILDVDQPAVQATKRRALERAGLEVPANLQLIEADLSQDPIPIASPDSLVVAEGLLMYLPRERAEALVRQAGRALLCSVLTEPRTDAQRRGFAHLERHLRRRGAPAFAWQLPLPSITAWLAGLGWPHYQHPDRRDLIARCRSGIGGIPVPGVETLTFPEQVLSATRPPRDAAQST